MIVALNASRGIQGGDIERNYAYDAQSNLLAVNDNLAGVAGVDLGFTYDQENRVETTSVSNFGFVTLTEPAASFIQLPS